MLLSLVCAQQLGAKLTGNRRLYRCDSSVCPCFAFQFIRRLANSIIVLSNFLGLFCLSDVEPGNRVRYVRSG